MRQNDNFVGSAFVLNIILNDSNSRYNGINYEMQDNAINEFKSSPLHRLH